MKLKIPLIAVLATSIITSSAFAQTASFVDFSGWVEGNPTDTVPWNGYSDVTVSVDYDTNSNGVNPNTGQLSPRAIPDIQKDIKAFGDPIPGLVMISGSLDDTNNDVGYTITYEYTGGAFPAESVFYIADVDLGDFFVNAFDNGAPVDTSNWFAGYSQTATEAFITANNLANGNIGDWDPAISSLVGSNEDSTHYAAQFAPGNTAYDTLEFTYTGGTRFDGIQFGMGNVILPVPEPTAALTMSLVGALSLLRRRR